MIVVKLQGGLGNQMFQYAAARRLASKKSTTLLLDISGYSNDNKRKYSLDIFNISAQIASPAEIVKASKSTYTEQDDCSTFITNVLASTTDVYLEGFFQNEQYFSEIRNTLIKDFTLKTGTPAELEKIKSEIGGNNSVSIHVRRGDYVSESKTKLFHGLCPVQYYTESILKIAQQIENPYFFAFSDDIEWTKQHLKTNFPIKFISSNHNILPAHELILMSVAKNHIIANSTFSWWAAWLCQNPNKIVLAPKNWFANSEMNLKTKIIPSNWQQVNIPDVSILMTVYNGEKYLNQAIDSILQQTLDNFELIIVNDGSTDSCPDILKKYTDPRIRLIHNKTNLGLIRSLNIGLEVARAQYIARMDQDDISLPDRLYTQYRFMEENQNIDLVGSWTECINESGKSIKITRNVTGTRAISYEFMFNNVMFHSSIFFRTDLIRENGGYSEQFIHSEDYEMYSRPGKELRCANIPKVLFKLRIHNQSITGSVNTQPTVHMNALNVAYRNINKYMAISRQDFDLMKDILIIKKPNAQISFKTVRRTVKFLKQLTSKFIQTNTLTAEQIREINARMQGRKQMMYKHYLIGKYRSIFKK